MTWIALKSILRNFLRLPQYACQGEINLLICLKVFYRSRTVLADVFSNVDKETSNRSEVQEANPVEFDMYRHTRVLGAVFPIRFDFDFADADLIVKHSIGSAVGRSATTPKLRKLGLRQFLQTPWTVVGVDVRVC